MDFKPMLASQATDLSSIRFPVMCSPKLDGIRAVCGPDHLLSRSLKPIRNRHTQELFQNLRGSMLDGELIVGKANDKGVYNRTNSGVMAFEGEPDVYLHVFDRVGAGSWASRYYHSALEKNSRIVVVSQTLCESIRDIEAAEERYLLEGYEGAMLRAPNGVYKFGRSSVREGLLLKLKRFTDAEAVIKGFVPKYHNSNPEQRNELGYIQRSKVSEGLVELDTLGALIVEDLVTGVEFQIGTGFTDEMRKWIWDARNGALPSMIVKYKSFEHGVKDRPRHPVFLGFRSAEDIGG